MIRLRILGGVDVRSEDGQALASLLAQRKRLGLLVYLALARPRGLHQRDSLLALFWPELDAERARNALSQAVHFLRRAVGHDVVVSRPGGEVGVDARLLWCDALAFERALDEGRGGEALELHRGPLLPAFHLADVSPELEQWLEGERARVERRYATLVESLAEERERAGDPRGAALWWEAAVARDPLNARSVMRLMHALAGAGDPAAAFRCARTHAAMLLEELGAPPDAQVAALASRLHAQRTGADGAPQVLAMAPHASPIAALVAAPVEPAAAAPAASAPPPSVTAATAPVPHGPHGRRRSRVQRVAWALLTACVVALGVELPRLYGAIFPIRVRSIAVLPVENLSGDPAQDFLAAGVTEALTTELAHYHGLRVISRTSAARQARSTKSLPEIARALRVDAVVVGSLVREGDRVRVDARLVHGASDRHLWAASYERRLGGLLALEQEIATVIAREVRVAAGPAGAQPAREATHAATEELYLRARFAWRARNPTAIRDAILLYQAAIGRDSTFAPAFAGLADAYRFYGGLNFGPVVPYMDSARTAVAQALALDSTLASAHASRAALLTDGALWTDAEREFVRAIELEPSNALAHHWYALLLVTLDRRDEALTEIRRAYALDPLSGPLNAALSEIESYVGARDQRYPSPERRTFVDPAYKRDHSDHALALAADAHCSDARTEMARARELSPHDAMVETAAVRMLLRCGDRAGARAVLDGMARASDARLNTTYLAMAYEALAEPDSAFAWLAREQYWGMVKRYELRTSGYLTGLRADPRFGRLLSRVGMPPMRDERSR